MLCGVGGGGGNALESMLQEGINGVSFIAANTDVQALKKFKDQHEGIELIQLGEKLTKGLGAGADPEVGKQAACETEELIQATISGADMLFITAGMGGGTGTGAAPEIARIATEMGILTVAVVTKPFVFEGAKRMQIAEQGISELTQYVDSLITIPNNKLISVLGKEVTLMSAFKTANSVLLGAVQGISNLITHSGLINVDFADVRTVMSEMGMAMMGTGVAEGSERAKQAAQAAIASPLLEDLDVYGAKGVLVNITASSSMSIGEFEEVGSLISQVTSEKANVVVGTVIDEGMAEALRVTVVVTGLDRQKQDVDLPNRAEYQRMNARPAYVKEAPPVVTPEPNVHVPTEASVIDAHENEDNAMPVTEPVKNVQSPREDSPAYLNIPDFLKRQEDIKVE
ncbi:cell division protein FtsZ [Gammaproteobacteria bacterium Comchoano-2]|uniref:Cell division protein FtsZ n=2 Tax=Candidatus Synchoanobacter obligatus TaxID=2919597 RepID=A0ABT1L4E4_9GAMM|nr:cell division protein FtsZ [Candidatus Synchoanobacter obligatus]